MDFPTSTMLYLFITVIVILIILYKSSYDFNYWKKRGVVFIPPLPIVGNFLDVFRLRISMAMMLAKLHNQMEAPYFGIYVLNKPYLILKDLDIIKNVLVKDFDYFYDRNMLCDEKIDSMASNMLFVVKNPEWKFLHSKVSPLFSTVKLKNMAPLITAVGEDLTGYLRRIANEEVIEAKELCAKFTTDVISSCAFGINTNSFESDGSTIFGRFRSEIFGFTLRNAIMQSAYFMAPSIVKFFKLPFIDSRISNFMRDTFWKTIKHRLHTKSKRNDLIDITIQIMNESTRNDKIKFEGDKVVAQALLYFIAGFETTSTTIAFTLYELCLHPDIQTRLRREIQDTVSAYGGFSYNAIQGMKYLHMVVSESLRKYPSVNFLDRQCVKDYRIPNSQILIEKGTPVFISNMALHYDPKYFPEPEKFDPERFSDDNKESITNYTYMPFGEGPRACIGLRFGLLAAKQGVAHIISEFELEVCKTTPIPVKFESRSVLLAAAGGLPIKFKRIVKSGLK